MFVRMGSFRIAPGAIDELRRIYLGECAPLVKAVSGNLDCCLLESSIDATAIAAWTVWRSEGDAIAYEMSGVAQLVVAKVRHLFAEAPTLASYRVRHTP